MAQSVKNPLAVKDISYTVGVSEWKPLSCLSFRPHGLYSPWNSPGQNTGVDSHSLFQGRGSSQPGDWTQVSRIQVDSLLAAPPGKAKNTGVGSLSLLQGIFPTEESKRVFCIVCGFSTSTAGDLGSIPGLGRSLKKEMATHCNILAWEIPWAEHGRLQSMALPELDTT